MLSELGRYRLGMVGDIANQTANAALASEEERQKQEQANLRRAAVARVVGGFNPAGTREQVYATGSQAMMNLAPYGKEGADAMDAINKNLEAHARMFPNHPAVAPKARPEDWADVIDQTEGGPPLTKDFGTERRRLQHRVYTDTGEPIQHPTTGARMYQYASGGTIREPKVGLDSKQQQQLDKLAARKQGLEEQLFRDHPQTNWTKVLAGTEPLPFEPGTGKTVVKSYKKNPDGTLVLDDNQRPIPDQTEFVGGKPAKAAQEYLNVVGQVENLKKQSGESVVPSKEWARRDLGMATTPAPTPTAAPGPLIRSGTPETTYASPGVPAPAGSRPKYTVVEFLQRFESQYGRKPTNDEINRAKGKYF